MAHFYMDDYFQEFSEYLADNYATELLQGDVESIYKSLIDDGNKADVTNGLADLFKETDVHYTFTLQAFFFYYLLYLLGPKNVKLKWFKSKWASRVNDYVEFSNMPIQAECRIVYDLDEDNFDGITDVDLGELNFIRNIKLPSTIEHFEIGSVWDNRAYNILDLSNVSNDFFKRERGWQGWSLFEKGIRISGSCITKVILPPNLKAIPNRFFSYCRKLKELTLPASLTRIESMAFEGCESLHEINYLGTKEQWKQMSRSTSWRRDSIIERVNCSDGAIILTRGRI